MMRICIGVLILGISSGAMAADIKTAYLQSTDGSEIEIATVTFTNADQGTSYEIAWKDDALDDYFLSMRPFKCVPSPEKLWCQVPYPYEIKRKVNDGDFTDLEYDFMFIWKHANDYGIDMWNGVYYEIEPVGDALIGRMTQLDMGRLAVPPAKGELRPIQESYLDEADPVDHWLPVLSIR